MESLKDLKPNPRNPRKITEEKLKMLKKSLEQFGDLSGFVYNVRSGQLIGGHQRAKALPPDAVLRIENRCPVTSSGTVAFGYVLIGVERFNYREVDWDEVTEKAANIAANKHGGEFDDDILKEWLLDLDTQNIDMDLTGFDKDELAELMAPIGQKGICRVQVGDVYRLDDNTKCFCVSIKASEFQSIENQVRLASRKPDGKVGLEMGAFEMQNFLNAFGRETKGDPIREDGLLWSSASLV